jgi:hypothetical protein
MDGGDLLAFGHFKPAAVEKMEQTRFLAQKLYGICMEQFIGCIQVVL